MQKVVKEFFPLFIKSLDHLAIVMICQFILYEWLIIPYYLDGMPKSSDIRHSSALKSGWKSSILVHEPEGGGVGGVCQYQLGGQRLTLLFET